MNKIDLTMILDNQNIKLISGRDFGDKIRRKNKLRDKDLDNESYMILFPSHVDYISNSFVLGLLGLSYIELGESRFRTKYTWNLENFPIQKRKIIENDINKGLEYIKNYAKDIVL